MNTDYCLIELQWTYMESFICVYWYYYNYFNNQSWLQGKIVLHVTVLMLIKPFLCLLLPSIQWIQNSFQRLLYLLGPALGKFFLMLWARFLFLFWLLNVFLTFMLASLLLFDNMGRRPLGCALVDFMPDFLLEIAVGCTLILELLCKTGK